MPSGIVFDVVDDLEPYFSPEPKNAMISSAMWLTAIRTRTTPRGAACRENDVEDRPFADGNQRFGDRRRVGPIDGSPGRLRE